MNYRHAFHAGGFADVVKHAVLALLIERLKQKDTAFRVIDTHAGIGLYDLTGDEARRSGEWRDGIGRLWQRDLDPDLAALLSPWLDAVKAANAPGDTLRRYPGSPWIARHLFRRQDRLTAVELHPKDAEALAALFAGDVQVRTIALDGWLALGAFVPPKERRGLVLVDPPYEEPDEFSRLLDGFANAHRRWPTGIYALWYPVKDLDAVDRLRVRPRQVRHPPAAQGGTLCARTRRRRHLQRHGPGHLQPALAIRRGAGGAAGRPCADPGARRRRRLGHRRNRRGMTAKRPGSP